MHTEITSFKKGGLLIKNGIFEETNRMNSARTYIEVNPEILGGTPVFRGTRVAIQTLFDY